MSHVHDASVTGAARRPVQRILLVDDDELELELMADRLKSLGFALLREAEAGTRLAPMTSTTQRQTEAG